MSPLLPFPPSGHHQSRVFDLSGLLDDVCKSLELESHRRGVDIEVDATPHTMIRGDREQLRYALDDLLAIILAAMPRGTNVVLTTLADEDGVELEIACGGSIFPGADQCVDSPHELPWGNTHWQETWSGIRRVITEGGAHISLAECSETGLIWTIYFPYCPDEDAGSRRAA